MYFINPFSFSPKVKFTLWFKKVTINRRRCRFLVHIVCMSVKFSRSSPSPCTTTGTNLAQEMFGTRRSVKGEVKMHWHLLTQNHWASFNQSWHKSSLVKGIQVYSNEELRPFPKEKYNEIVKMYLQHLKIFFSRTIDLIQLHVWVKGIHVCSNNGQRSFPRADDLSDIVHWQHLVQICFDEIVCKILRNRGNGPKVVWKKGSVQFSEDLALIFFTTYLFIR